MQNLKYWMFLISLMVILIGCQPQNEPLPTQIDLNATNEALAVVQTQSAEDATLTAAAPTATSLRPTLPPTFTPTIEVTPIDTPTPTLDPSVSPSPEGFSDEGTIYYNYNGDSIARVLPDGSLNEIIITFGVDQPISDLTASPDGQLLAFVAPGSGSAREVWVSNRDGSYLQQVSCLGYNDVRKPTFAADSNRIAFFAAPLVTTNKALYVADFAGSNDCPTGNNQQLLFPVSTTQFGDITWNASGDLVYYNAGGTFVYDFASGSSYVLTGDNGFGTDFGLTYNLETNQLAYLRAHRNLTTGERGGSIVVVDDANEFRAEYDIQPVEEFAKTLEWGGDDESLLYATDEEIVIYEIGQNVRLTLQRNLPIQPLARFSPNYDNYVYTNLDPETGVMQLYTGNRLDTRDTQQVTFNPEGTIINVIWLEG